MTRVSYAGASWIDGWPDGRQARLYEGSHIQTHIGRVDLPLGESFGLMFLKVTPQDVPFKLGGKLHDTGDASLVQEWRPNAGWLPERESPTGRCVYLGDALTDYVPNGFSYVDEQTGQGVPYNDTYGPREGISQWCEVGGLLIGQAHDPIVAPDDTGLILWDGSVHRLIEGGLCPAYTAHRIGEAVTINIAKNGYAVVIGCTMAELRALPPVVTPGPEPIPEPIGPRSEPVAAGTVIPDLLPYVRGEQATWPRRGPSHTLGQKRRGDFWDYVKFAGNEPGAANGESYETWWANPDWIGQLEDASAYDPYQQTDQRMWPRRMQVGEAHAFKTGEHEIVWRRRPGAPVTIALADSVGHRSVFVFDSFNVQPCQEVKREPWQRRMWLHTVWPAFYCGPDLGVRAVAMLVYDATAGFFIPGRYIECGLYAFGAGSIEWQAHKSWLLYPPGATTAQFSEATLAERKSFYLIGGPDPNAKLLGCVPQTVPDYGPWPPTPDPPTPEPYYRARSYEGA